MPRSYLSLLIAVLFETAGTLALQASAQFTKPLPIVIMTVCYLLSFYFMSLVLKFMPVGVVYAIWSGLGIIFIAIFGYFLFGQKLDFAALAGMGLIIAGVVVINIFSGTSTH